MAMILKIIGLSAVFSFCGGLGFLKSLNLKRRAEELKILCGCLSELLSRLKYEETEKLRILSDAFRSKEIIEITGKEIVITDKYLNRDDKSILNEFLNNFGKADGETEENRINLYLSMFSEEYTAAEKDAAEQGKLYRTAGICAGAALCLFLI